MRFQLMGSKIQVRLEDHELLVQTFPIRAQKVILSEVNFQGVVVEVILVITSQIPAITDMTPLVAFSTMVVELIESIEELLAETALGMTLEAGLVRDTGIIIPNLLMNLQLAMSEQFMLMREDLFVLSAEITTGLSAHSFCRVRPIDLPQHSTMKEFHVSVEIRPSQTDNIAVWIRAIEAKECYCIFVDGRLLEIDPKTVIHIGKVISWKVLVQLGTIVGEGDIVGRRLNIHVSVTELLAVFDVRTLQCAHAVVLYKALSRSAQTWHVRWLHGATA